MYAHKDDRKVIQHPSLIASEASNPAGDSSESLKASQLAEIYNVSDKSIQGWISLVSRAHPWLPPEQLKTGRSNKTKYTPLCQQLIRNYRESGMTGDEWVQHVHNQNLDKLGKEQTSPEQSLQKFGWVAAETVQDTEFVEPGAIELTGNTYAAQPILQINVDNLMVALPTVDTTSIERQVQKLQAQTVNSVDALQHLLTADFKAKLQVALAQNSHVVVAVQANAIHQTVRDLGLGKPVEGDSSSPS